MVVAIVLVCPVCQHHHQKEVSKCQRCNWLMQPHQNILEISPNHPILQTCIPTLVNRLEEETKSKNNLLSLIQTLDPDSQKTNNQKLDEILDRLETDREKYIQAIENLKDQILVSLKLSTERKNDNRDINVETTNSSKNNEYISPLSSLGNSSVDFESRTVSNMEDRENYSDDYSKSDREANNLFYMNNDDREDSLYNPMGDREFSKDLNSQENIEPEVSSSGSYQSFYHLIKNGELKIIEVKVPQETMEKMRGGTQSDLTFVNDRKGNYWIVHWHEIYCLIPKEKTYINQYQYGNFQRIFECQKYQENYSDFEVIEPATVFKCDDETWQLERKGKIKFI